MSNAAFIPAKHNTAVVLIMGEMLLTIPYFEEEGRKNGFSAVNCICIKWICTLFNAVKMLKRKLPPHFFAQILGKKITKTQVFTSLREAQLHLKPKVFFTSSPNSGSLACLSRHSSQSDGGWSRFIPLSLHCTCLPRRSKAKTGEVAACGGRMCFFLQRTWRCLNKNSPQILRDRRLVVNKKSLQSSS